MEFIAAFFKVQQVINTRGSKSFLNRDSSVSNKNSFDQSYLFFLDPYVKLLLFHNDKRIAKRKTHVKRNTLNPTFDDTFDFDLPYEEDNLKNIKLDCVLLDRDRTSKNTVVGHVAFGGENCKGTALKHWSEIITFPSREVEKWHKLCD